MAHGTIEAIRWRGQALELLDQRLLPGQETYLSLTSAADTAAAIRNMVVRGAPAIGVTAAYGVVLAAMETRGGADWRADMKIAMDTLGDARPTAVNLRWALARMQRRLDALGEPDADALLGAAQALHEEDVAQNRRMGELGAALFERPVSILTHCNTGGLATAGHGTALGVVRTAHEKGLVSAIYAGETRPWLQGARLTAWELWREGIAAELIADSAAAWLMRSGRVDWVVTGADRVAANGDVANKIGTYSLAVAARHHGLRFMVVAPTGTVDLATSEGDSIPIEERDGSELTRVLGEEVPPFAAYNPVFDVTPAELVDVLVTEKGVVRCPDTASVAAMMANGV
jgi:methylthioribose-1-phosphate isomerase